MKYILTEQNLDLTLGEKIRDILFQGAFANVFAILFIPIILLLIPVIIIILLLGLVYEGLIEKTYYKLTGKKPKVNTRVNPLINLPIQVDLQSIYFIDGLVEKMKVDYGWNDEDFRDLELFKIITVPEIPGLASAYFDFDAVVFNDDVFLQKVSLPDFKYTLCYLDCKQLTFIEFNDIELKGYLKFDKFPDKITIQTRGYLTKKRLTIKYR